MSNELHKAREYEASAEKQVKNEQRPSFHLSPRIGWMNDPNGFSYYNGQFHLFYQYHPYNTHWGSIHWGHAVSDDMISWNYLPAAMAPDEYYDIDGCWSGSAVTMQDGRQLLIYTGFRRDENDIEGRGFQSQNLAFGDGLYYEKYSRNPVITADMASDKLPCYDFRDPKIWEDEKGYHVVACIRAEKGPTKVVEFSSENALDWKFERVLKENHDTLGLMWECPDYFELDGRKVLLVSAMDMIADGYDFHSGNNSIYFLGTEKSDGSFEEECCCTLDYGMDFYAPQTMIAPDGRRIMIGWMQNPDTAGLRTRKDPVFGQMTIPRQLRVKNGRLCQIPVREIEAYRTNEVNIRDCHLEGDKDKGEIKIPGIHGRFLDMYVEIEPEEEKETYKSFSLKFAKDDQFYTEFRFVPEKSLATLNRKYSGQRRAIENHRDVIIQHANGKFNFRIILDRYSAEIFINDGEKVMTTTFITDPDAEMVTFHCDGSLKLNVTSFELHKNQKL